MMHIPFISILLLFLSILAFSHAERYREKKEVALHPNRQERDMGVGLNNIII